MNSDILINMTEKSNFINKNRTMLSAISDKGTLLQLNNE